MSLFRKTLIFLGVVGFVLVAYAMTLEPYSNAALFQQRYMELKSGQSAEYWQLRQEMLTPKYRLIDYGITFLLCSVLGLFFTRGNRLCVALASNRGGFIALATILPFMSVGAYLFDIFQGLARDEYPHWADSVGIVLAGIPFLLITLLIWSFLHISVVMRASGSLLEPRRIFSNDASLWLRLLAFLTACIFGLLVITGGYWYAIPIALWTYFYLSIAAKRIAIKDNYAVETVDC